MAEAYRMIRTDICGNSISDSAKALAQRYQLFGFSFVKLGKVKPTTKHSQGAASDADFSRVDTTSVRLRRSASHGYILSTGSRANAIRR
jgi:hypothetical protein